MLKSYRISIIIRCFYESVIKTIDDDGVEHAGYMAFMFMLTLFPFLVFVLALTSFFGVLELGEAFIQLLIDNFPENITSSVQSAIYELKKAPPKGLLNLAIFGTVWTASSFVEGLRTILNRINEVIFPPPYILRRLLSITQFIFISLVVSLAMLILVVVPISLNKMINLGYIIENLSPIWQYLRYSLIFISLLFTVVSLYYFIPNTKVSFRNILPGAAVTVVLWLISASLLSNYINYFTQVNLVYGSLGSIISSLWFFYIINISFIYGAAFNFVYNKEKINERVVNYLSH